MALKFFENAVDNDMVKQPNDMYRDNQQAFIDEQWDNTSTKSPENGGSIYEQSAIGSTVYNVIEAWVKPTVADVTRGATDTRDYLKLVFKSINHETVRGLYYTFDNNYWIVHSYNHFNGLPQDVGIRRCNNYLRIVDPENGSIFSTPCVVDYDMMSPGNQIGRYLITPNGHITVITQANDDTLRLFTLNKRFVLDGRVFRINAYQNSLEYSSIDKQTTILYLDMYLDEQHATDDMINQVADNGEYIYSIVINSDDMELTNGSTGSLSATVTLNGNETDSGVVWSTSNKDIVSITNAGVYSVVGDVGQSAIITATINGNTTVTDSITITIAAIAEIEPVIVLDPVFDKVRQYQTIEFDVDVEYNGQHIETPTNVNVSVNSDAVSISQQNNKYYLTCRKINQTPIVMTINVSNISPSFSATKQFYVKTVSMLG